MASGIIIDVGFESRGLEEYINSIKQSLSSVDFNDAIGLEKVFKEQAKKVRSELSNLEKEMNSSMGSKSISDVQSKYASVQKSLSSIMQILKEMARVSPNSSMLSSMLDETNEIISGVKDAKSAVEDFARVTGGKDGKLDIVSESSTNNINGFVKSLKSAEKQAISAIKNISSAKDVISSELRSDNGLLDITTDDLSTINKNGRHPYKNTKEDLSELKKRIDDAQEAFSKLDSAIKEQTEQGLAMDDMGFAKNNIEALELVLTLVRLQKTYEKLTGEQYGKISLSSNLESFKGIEANISDAIADNDSEVGGSIKTVVSGVQAKLDSSNNIIIGMKISDSASSSLYTAASQIIEGVSSQIASDPLQIRVALVSDYRSKKISGYMEDITASLGGIDDEEVKQNLQKVVNDMQYQVGEAIHLKVEIENQKQVENNIQSFVKNLQTEFENAEFIVSPKVEISDEAKSDLSETLQEIADNTTIKIKFDESTEEENGEKVADKKNKSNKVVDNSNSIATLVESLKEVSNLSERIGDTFRSVESALGASVTAESEFILQLCSKFISLNKEIEKTKALLGSIGSNANVKSEYSSGNDDKADLNNIFKNANDLTESLNKITSKFGKMDSEKLEKLKTTFAEVKTSLEGFSELKESPLLEQLNKLATDKENLKNLSTVLKANKNQINNAKNQISNDEFDKAKEVLTQNESGIGLSFENFINQSSGGSSVISKTLEATKEGFIQVTAFIQEATGEYKKFIYLTKDGQDFSLSKVISGDSALKKDIKMWNDLQKLQKQSQNIKSTPTSIFLQQGDDNWNTLINKMKQFGIEASSVTKIIQNLDRDGFESFQVFTNSGERFTLGIDSDEILVYKNELLSSEEAIDSFKTKVKSLKSLFKGGISGDAVSSQSFIDSLNEILALYKRLQEYNQIGVIDDSQLSSLKEYFKLFINSDMEQIGVGKIANDNKTESFIANLEEAKDLLDKIRSTLNTSIENDGFLSEETVLNVENLITKLKDLNSTSKNVENNYAKSANIEKLYQKIYKDTQNTGMPKQLKIDYDNLIKSMKSFGDKIPNDKLKEFQETFGKLHTTFTRLNPGLSILDSISSKAKNLSKDFIATYFSFQDFIRYSKEAFNIIREIDTAMTELKRVTDLSDAQYTNLFQKATESAQEYGRTISNTINATADWVRLGFSSDNAVKIAGVSAMYQNVTDLDEDTAVDNLVTAYKGFEEQLLKANSNDQTASMTEIVDVYDKLGKTCP